MYYVRVSRGTVSSKEKISLDSFTPTRVSPLFTLETVTGTRYVRDVSADSSSWGRSLAILIVLSLRICCVSANYHSEEVNMLGSKTARRYDANSI